MARMWRRTPGLAMLAAMRKVLGLFGSRLSPRLLVDAVIRLGAGGDRFGLRRGGLTFSRLAADHPHGTVLARNLRAGVLADTVVYRGAPDAAAAPRDRRRNRRRCRADARPTAIRCG